MQLKAQNPTLGNEATGTEQAALQRLDAGMGLMGLAALLIPARNRTLQLLLPRSTFVTYRAFRTLKKFRFGRCGNWLTAQRYGFDAFTK